MNTDVRTLWCTQMVFPPRTGSFSAWLGLTLPCWCKHAASKCAHGHQVCSRTSYLSCSLHLCSYQCCFSARLPAAETWSIYAVYRIWVVFAQRHWKVLLFVKELSPFPHEQVFADVLISGWKSRVAETGAQNWYFSWISKQIGALKILSRTQSTTFYASKQPTRLTGFSWIQKGNNLMESLMIWD